MKKVLNRRFGFFAIACFGLGILLGQFCLSRPAEASGGLAAMDGTWILTESRVNNTVQTLAGPYSEIRYILDTSTPSLRREWWNTEGDFEHDEARYDVPNVAVRGQSSFTLNDISEITNAGLSPSSVDGVLEFDVAPSIQLRVAFTVTSGGGADTATLVPMYQSGPWQLPTASCYDIRPAGQGAGNLVYTNATGNRYFTRMTWRRQ